jgi:hypothetical protein
MDFDKSPGFSSETSIFSLASTVLQRFTQAVASKALDFSLATGFPPSKRKRRQKRLSAVVKMAGNLTGMENLQNLGKDVAESRDQFPAENRVVDQTGEAEVDAAETGKFTEGPIAMPPHDSTREGEEEGDEQEPNISGTMSLISGTTLGPGRRSSRLSSLCAEWCTWSTFGCYRR